MTSASDGGVRQRQLDGMLAVTRAVAAAGDLDETLQRVAREATGVVTAQAASIVLPTGGDTLRLAGAWGLSERFRLAVEGRRRGGEGATPPQTAIAERRPVVITDVEHDGQAGPWRSSTLAEGHRSLLSLPLIVEAEAVGALTVHRAAAGDWQETEIGLLGFFAEHAAHAIRTADLINRQDRQLAAMTRVLSGLRERIHEHANRLHSIDGLLALGDVSEVRRFVAELLVADLEIYGAITQTIEEPTLAGLVLAEMMIARQRDIAIRLDRRSRLRELPAGVSTAETVTILGLLLRTAVDAVADAPPDRRRVTVAASSRPDALVLKTRDWGTRPDGLGVSVLADAVTAARGSVRTTADADGRTTIVTLPAGTPAPTDGERVLAEA